LTNKKGVTSAIGALNGARGGTDIPSADRKSVYAHLAKHLKDNNIEAAKLKDSFDINDYNGNIKEFTESINFNTFLTEKLDYKNGIIEDISLLSPISKNRRTYTKEVLEECVYLAEDTKVYADHPNSSNVRSIKDIIGKITEVYLEEGTNILRGNLHILNKWKEHIFDMVENMPDIAGMSINASGVLKKGDNGFDVVEKVLKIFSIDLVSEPATTNGFFEQEEENKKDLNEKEKGDSKLKMEITLETLKNENADILKEYHDEIMETLKIDNLKESYNKMENSVKELETKVEELNESLTKSNEEKETVISEKTKLEEELKSLKAELDEFKVKEALAQKKAIVNDKIAESELPDIWITEVFKETLIEADEDKIDALISDRKSLFESVKKEEVKEEMGNTKDPDKIMKEVENKKEEKNTENKEVDVVEMAVDSIFGEKEEDEDDD